MRTQNNLFVKLFRILICLFLVILPATSYAYFVSSLVKKGTGTISIFKAGVQIASTTVLNTGDTITVFASPADSEGLESLVIGTSSYKSAPINVVIGTANVAIEASFATRTVYFQESFGKLSTAAVAEFYQEADSVYNGYDNATEAIFSATNAATKVKNYSFGKSTFTTDATELYMQNSNFTIKMYCDKIINAYNLQVKFRLIPVNNAGLKFSFSNLDVKINDETARKYIGNEPLMPIFSTISTTQFKGISYACQAPFTIINFTGTDINPITLSSINFKINTITGFLNRCRIDDLIITGDNVLSSTNQINDVDINSEIKDNKLFILGKLYPASFIRLYNMLGVEINQTKVIDDNPNIKINNIPNGIYLITVNDLNNKIHTLKISINH